MTRLKMLAALTVCAFVFQAVTSADAAPAAPAAAPSKPNILFVLIDDMGYGDLSCFGGTRAKTPNIDKLASEGVRFTQFYVNSPICSPSRVALTTGQYPNRWRITSYLARRDEDAQRGIADWLDPKAPTLARTLQQAGYHTAHVGKWHMGGQRDVIDAPAITSYGFDTSITNFEGLGPRILGKFEKLDHGPTATSAKFAGEADVQWVERHKVSEKFVDRAIAEMDVAVKQDKPFYINLWPDDVHSPCQAPPDQRGDGSPAAQYVGVLNELDRQLGRAFDHIRSTEKLRDNTIILLCSDNGQEPGLGSSGGLRGAKGQLYEGGIRSPLIVWFPTRMASKGQTNDKTLLAAIDMAPSLLAIAGVSAPTDSKFDGLDMSDALLGRGQPDRTAPVMWLRPPDRPGPQNKWPDLAIRDGRWKLLVDRDGSQPELFDIAADPNESKNLAEAHREIVRELSGRVSAWDRETTK
jgi:uncharacterized sulfatase